MRRADRASVLLAPASRQPTPLMKLGPVKVNSSPSNAYDAEGHGPPGGDAREAGVMLIPAQSSTADQG